MCECYKPSGEGMRSGVNCDNRSDAVYCDCRESRAEQADVRFKDYRRELKEHAQALQRVGKELQAERTNRERLKAELEQCRLELASVKKELQEEKGTGNLLRDQVGH